VLGVLADASWRTRLQPIDRGWLDMMFSVPLVDTTRARTVLDWSPGWGSAELLADVIDGFRHDSGTPSPVLQSRSLVEAVARDVTDGPLTTRRVP
jgi:hypothetical protein